MTDRIDAKVAILVEDLYQELELWYPYYRLREAGADVTIVGPKAEHEYKSKHGYPARSQRASASLRADEFDAVIVPGGYAPDLMRRDADLVRFVREMDASGKVVAAICHAGWVLVSAGVLRGRRATCFRSIKDDVIAAGARYEDTAVVRDGNLITSRQPDDLPAFASEIIGTLAARRGRSVEAAAK